jgi:purine-binding chemotaxis protein CheW
MQNNHNQQYVTFTLNQDLYGLAVTQAREILDHVSVTKVPHSSEEMLGVINLRGQVVPVIDMHLKLRLPAKEEGNETNYVIVAEVDIDGEVHIVGIQVDEVREVLELANDMIEPAPRLGTHINTRFIKGMGKIDEQFMVLLDINRLFDEAEITEFQAVGELDAEASGELLEA